MLPSWIRSRNCRPRFGVLLRDRDDEPKVGLDELLLGLLGLDLAALDRLDRPHQLVGRLLEVVGHGLDLDLELLLPPQQVLLFFFLEPAVLLVLGIELPFELVDLAPHAHHGLDRLLDLIDQPALDRLGELDAPDELRELDPRPQRLPPYTTELPLVAGRRAAWRLLELLLALLEAHPRLSDRLDLPKHLTLAVIDLVVGQLFVDKRHELADASLFVLELIAHRHDRAGDRRRAGDRLDDRQLAAFDALGDLDLALAGEEGHGAHLAEVHADRIVGLVECAGGQVELELLGSFPSAVQQLVFAILLFGIDDLDPGAAERAEQIIELVRRRDVGGQELVDLVVQQVSLFLADGNELLHFIVFFFNRQRRVLLTSSFRANQNNAAMNPQSTVATFSSDPTR